MLWIPIRKWSANIRPRLKTALKALYANPQDSGPVNVPFNRLLPMCAIIPSIMRASFLLRFKSMVLHSERKFWKPTYNIRSSTPVTVNNKRWQNNQTQCARAVGHVLKSNIFSCNNKDLWNNQRLWTYIKQRKQIPTTCTCIRKFLSHKNLSSDYRPGVLHKKRWEKNREDKINKKRINQNIYTSLLKYNPFKVNMARKTNRNEPVKYRKKHRD